MTYVVDQFNDLNFPRRNAIPLARGVRTKLVRDKVGGDQNGGRAQKPKIPESFQDHMAEREGNGTSAF